jgi:hypothetical protein
LLEVESWVSWPERSINTTIVAEGIKNVDKKKQAGQPAHDKLVAVLSRADEWRSCQVAYA